VDSSAKKAANQATFRAANDELEVLALDIEDDDPGRRYPFLCECNRRNCTQVVLLTIADYEHARSNGRYGFMALGHEDETIETVIKRADGFVVTEKRGTAAEVHELTDPRS
jgi:hypothetical protein